MTKPNARKKIRTCLTILLRAGVSPRLLELVPESPDSPIELRVSHGSVWVSSPACGERVVTAGEVFRWDGDPAEIVESLSDTSGIEIEL